MGPKVFPGFFFPCCFILRLIFSGKYFGEKCKHIFQTIIYYEIFPPNLSIIQRLNSSSLYLVGKSFVGLYVNRLTTLCIHVVFLQYWNVFPFWFSSKFSSKFSYKNIAYICCIENLHKRCLIQEVVGVLYNKCIFLCIWEVMDRLGKTVFITLKGLGWGVNENLFN